MTLRRRIATISAAVVIGANGVLFYLGSRAVGQGFGTLERAQARHRAALVARQVEGETARISELALDYAAWDDMRAYVASPSEPFIESALPPNWLPRMRLHLAAVLDTDGRVLFARSVSDGKAGTGLPVDFLPHIARGRPLVTHGSTRSSASGILMLADGAWIVAARPIVTSAGDGPVRGTFVLGRQMDEQLLAQFSRTIALPVRADAMSMGASPVGGGFAIRLDDSETMTALAPLTDVYGRPASVMGVHVPRDVEAQRRGTQYYLGWALLVASSIFLVTVTTLLNHYIVKRMSIFARFLRKVDASGNLAARLDAAGRDEIGLVATAINDLLATIEARNRDLEEARAQALAAVRESGQKNAQLEQANLLIERLARTDPLTNLANRRMFDECLVRQISRAARHGEPFTIIMADLDGFKSMNDDYGHLAGDQVLIHTAAAISAEVRVHDVAARYGGEEFVLLMADTGLAEATAVAERIRAHVERLQVPDSTRSTTISLGVAQWIPGETAATVLKRADDALLRAKRAGRNRVEASGVRPLGAVARPACRDQKRARTAR